MIFQYKYLYYIPAIYIVFTLVRWINDDALYFSTWYPILITFSFVISGIISILIKMKLDEKYKNHEKNFITQLTFFFAIWLFCIYDFPIFKHTFSHESIKVNAKILQFDSYMGGGRYNYTRHYDVTIRSNNDQFNNRKIKALDNSKYYYLHEDDNIILIGEISTFMFKLKKVSLGKQS